MNKKQKFISQCCVCKKVKRKEGYQFTDKAHMDQWDHHEEDLKKAHEEFDVIYSHTFCDDCVGEEHKKIEEHLKNKSP